MIEPLVRQVWGTLGGMELPELQVSGAGALPSAFAVTELATASIATAGVAVHDWIGLWHRAEPAVSVDRRLASLWFGFSIRPEGWTLPAPWDPIAGDYLADDGWIRLHTNAPHHKRAALVVLGVADHKAEVERAVSRWNATDLETAIVSQGGCAAAMRSLDAWRKHGQGAAVMAEPLFHITRTPSGPTVSSAAPPANRPLNGIRVLDLTRVLAGPVATRFLAGLGADVLRIDPPDWDEPGIVPEVNVGKRCARLDLHNAEPRREFEQLLAGADILVHGYRPGALDRLGLDSARRQAIRPGLIDVSLDAYGWSGPWQARRGFDSLVQMSTGIADFGMKQLGRTRPTPLPVQALDHATGYLMSAAAVRGLTERAKTGSGVEVRTSLARVADLLVSLPAGQTGGLAGETPNDYAAGSEQTAWGTARRLKSPLRIGELELQWTRGPAPLGSSAAAW